MAKSTRQVSQVRGGRMQQVRTSQSLKSVTGSHRWKKG
jgi:hypothetical protein